MLKRGTVVWFNQKEGFGFLSSNECEKDIFFHINDKQKPEMTYFRGEMIVICKRPVNNNGFFRPKVGDQLYFSISYEKEKGPSAKYWVFATEYENILKTIQNLPIYRVVHKFYDKSQREMWKGIWPSFCPEELYNHKIDKVPQQEGNWLLEKYWQTKLVGQDDSCWEKCEYPLHNFYYE